MSDDLNYIKNICKNLALREAELEIHEVLQGGVVSIVASGTYIADGERTPVAVKHTKKEIKPGAKFCYHDIKDFLSNAYASQKLDAQILEDLQENTDIKVPKLIKYFEKENVTILENFNPDGFGLLQDSLIKGEKLDPKVFENIGRTLAHINNFSKNSGKKYKGLEDPQMQMEQRFVELMTSLYDGRMQYFNQLWEDIHNSENRYFGWPDGHPKNIAVDKENSVLIFDFGRSVEFDLDYVLPNFLAHILLFSLTGAIDFELGIQYVQKTIQSFNSNAKKLNPNYTFNERKFVWYAVAEIAHRGKTMRWIDPAAVQLSGDRQVDIPRVKAAVDHLIDLVFTPEKATTNLGEFFEILENIDLVLRQKPEYYRRPIF